jgi:hypothetical protein
VRYGLRLNRDPGSKGAFVCADCTAELKEHRNCNNYLNKPFTILHGQREFDFVTRKYHRKAVHKLDGADGDMRLFECPLSLITSITSRIIRLVNESIDYDGVWRAFPFGGTDGQAGGLHNQPLWLREAVEIVIEERSEDRRQQQQDKTS